MLKSDPVAARAALKDLIALDPSSRSAWAYLAQLEFAEGHDRAFLDAARRKSEIRKDAGTAARIDRYGTILGAGGHAALVQAMQQTYRRVAGRDPSTIPTILASEAIWPDR